PPPRSAGGGPRVPAGGARAAAAGPTSPAGRSRDRRSPAPAPRAATPRGPGSSAATERSARPGSPAAPHEDVLQVVGSVGAVELVDVAGTGAGLGDEGASVAHRLAGQPVGVKDARPQQGGGRPAGVPVERGRKLAPDQGEQVRQG